MLSTLITATRIRRALTFMLSAVAIQAWAAPLRIGVQAPLSGPYANEGHGIENAVKLIAGQINQKGGLLGQQIDVIVCDDGALPEKAKSCAKTLVDQGVFAVIGSYTTDATAASQPIYAQAHILQTSDAAAEQLVLNGYTHYFRNGPSNGVQAHFTAHYLVNVKHYRRIEVLSDHSKYSQDLGDAVVRELKKRHEAPIYRGFITPGAKSFDDVLKVARDKRADAIYFSGYYSDGGRLRAEEVNAGITADFVGGGANQNVQFLQLAGPAAKGAVIINFPSPENLPYPGARTFLKAYREAYGTAPPSIYTLYNGDGTMLIVTAAMATNSVDPDRIARYIHQRYHYVPWEHRLNFFPGMTGRIGFNSFGDRTGGLLNAFRIEADGSYKTVYPHGSTD